MNATRILASQHRAIEALFDTVAHETRRQVRARAAACLIEELIAHMTAEETIFYPAARSVLGSAPAPVHAALVGHTPDGHFMLRAQLRRVLATNIHTPAFAPRFEALRTLFAHHVETEEHEVFPRVEALFPASKLETLGTEVQGARPSVWMVTTEREVARPRREPALRGVSLPSLTEN